MSVLFDTSVLVPALVEQLPNHPSAFEIFVERTQDGAGAACSTHALAECYAVLTALPLRRRITGAEARRLIDESIAARMETIELGRADYDWAIDRIAARGITGGAVYDALHVAAAQKHRCNRIYTFNVRHFRALAPTEIAVLAP